MTSLLISGLLGSMIFFVFVVSPTVFSSLPSKQSSKFLRKIFPRMFLFGFILSIMGSLLAYYENLIGSFFLLLCISILFILNRNFLTPLINKYRDLQLEGNKSSSKIFKLLHLFSVIIFVTTMICLVIILIFI